MSHKAKHAWTVADLETAPLPEQEINRWLPDWVDWEESMFDPASVKVGNVKDPVKIKAKIDKAREDSERSHIEEQTKRINAVVDKAALNPHTGWIFGYGKATPDGVTSTITLDIDDEPGIIREIWEAIGNTRTLVNHNLLGFDLPFLIARSMIRNVSIPFRVASLKNFSGSEIYINKSPIPTTLIDTQKEAERFAPKQRPSLNWLLKFLDLGQKVELDKLPWDIAQEDLNLCREYTEGDADLTAKAAMKMQLID